MNRSKLSHWSIVVVFFPRTFIIQYSFSTKNAQIYISNLLSIIVSTVFWFAFAKSTWTFLFFSNQRTKFSVKIVHVHDDCYDSSFIVREGGRRFSNLVRCWFFFLPFFLFFDLPSCALKNVFITFFLSNLQFLRSPQSAVRSPQSLFLFFSFFPVGFRILWGFYEIGMGGYQMRWDEMDELNWTGRDCTGRDGTGLRRNEMKEVEYSWVEIGMSKRYGGRHDGQEFMYCTYIHTYSTHTHLHCMELICQSVSVVVQYITVNTYIHTYRSICRLYPYPWSVSQLTDIYHLRLHLHFIDLS